VIFLSFFKDSLIIRKLKPAVGVAPTMLKATALQAASLTITVRRYIFLISDTLAEKLEKYFYLSYIILFRVKN